MHTVPTGAYEVKQSTGWKSFVDLKGKAQKANRTELIANISIVSVTADELNCYTKINTFIFDFRGKSISINYCIRDPSK